ncbi:hypothetical protein AB0K00_04185 [Dactylosporangium sp. NPDC049525]|uniref:hypothetical protein n=1 Tax=Dactylosporangium sp. NPDC049525 TaxID=3154730 RepID=UPI0034213793
MLAAELPKVTDWMQGWASVLAFLAAGGLLCFELWRNRRERADTAAAQARLIFSRVTRYHAPNDHLQSVKWTVFNYSAAPIFDVSVKVVAPVAAEPSTGDTVIDVIRGGDEPEEILTLDPPPQFSQDTPIHDLKLEVTFTDSAGLNWRRVDRKIPTRVIRRRAWWADPARLAATAVALGVAGVVIGLFALMQ